MMGALPSIFSGNREQADNFIKQLKGYIQLNWLVPGMNSYIQQVALALTLIQGPLVAEWHKNIGEWIDRLTPQDDIQAVWDHFLDKFTSQFQDSQCTQRVMIELKQLKMKWPNIDQYINDFKKLVCLTGYTLGNQETMGFFLEGLPRSVVEAILIPPTPDTYAVTLLRALRPDIGGWVTLSPRYWTGVPSDTSGGRAPYSAVLDSDLSWSSKLARCLSRQCKRICAKAETNQR